MLCVIGIEKALILRRPWKHKLLEFRHPSSSVLSFEAKGRLEDRREENLEDAEYRARVGILGGRLPKVFI